MGPAAPKASPAQSSVHSVEFSNGKWVGPFTWSIMELAVLPVSPPAMLLFKRIFLKKIFKPGCDGEFMERLHKINRVDNSDLIPSKN